MIELVALLALAQDKPFAYVLEHDDQWTRSSLGMKMLEEGGFQVRSLPLEEDPSQLQPGLIVIGSFATDLPGVPQYLQARKEKLLEWTRRGNVLLQLTQSDQVEAAPTFLPEGFSAKRNDLDIGSVKVFDSKHPLNQSVPATVAFHRQRTVWESFHQQEGFKVLMASDESAANPALMEAEVGRGRILLSSMPVDKTVAPINDLNLNALETYRKTFAANLFKYVEMVREGDAPDVKPTPTQSELGVRDDNSWTLAVLPDTQVYAESYPGIFTAQTGFLVQNQRRMNIKFAVQLGDITNRNTRDQWENARDAMSLLDGRVNYAIVGGNHDYGPGGNAATRETFFNEFFPLEQHAKQSTYGGAFEAGKMDNTYHRFEAGGRKWIVIALEWGPRNEAVAWADKVMTDHKDHTGILITHAYMFNDDTRYDWKKYGDKQPWNPYAYGTPKPVNDGEDLWQKLVQKHNFAFTLNGHVLGDGAAYLASKNDAGKTTHQILQNYQMRELGGQGYLRLFEFLPDNQTVRIRTYSPIFDRFMATPDQSFDIKLD